MNSVQESKQELEAAIRYAENAISSAKQTIESMEFRQEMAKKQFSEQTGREESLTKLVKELEELNEKLAVDNSNLEKEVQRQQDLGQGYYDTMMTYKSQIALLEERIADMQADMVGDAATIKKLRDEKEASSGPCGCQAYRDLEEARGRAEGEVELLQRTIADLEAQVNALEQPERPTMPVIPKAVAIAIFREGMQHGVEAACTELEGQTIEVEESEYYGHFEVSFGKSIELDEELDLDWMRGKVGDYSEDFVTGALGNLCADKGFECRIHGIDDQEEKKND